MSVEQELRKLAKQRAGDYPTISESDHDYGLLLTKEELEEALLDWMMNDPDPRGNGIFVYIQKAVLKKNKEKNK